MGPVIVPAKVVLRAGTVEHSTKRARENGPLQPRKQCLDFNDVSSERTVLMLGYCTNEGTFVFNLLM